MKTLDDKSALTVRLGPSKAKLIQVARDADVSVSLIVRLAVDHYLESLASGQETNITIPVSENIRDSLRKT